MKIQRFTIAASLMLSFSALATTEMAELQRGDLAPELLKNREFSNGELVVEYSQDSAGALSPIRIHLTARARARALCDSITDAACTSAEVVVLDERLNVTRSVPGFCGGQSIIATDDPHPPYGLRREVVIYDMRGSPCDQGRPFRTDITYRTSRVNEKTEFETATFSVLQGAALKTHR